MIRYRSFCKRKAPAAGYQRTAHSLPSSYQLQLFTLHVSSSPRLQSCVRARPLKMPWLISVEMADDLLLTTLVANFCVLSILILRPHGERLKPLPLQLWVQVFMTLAGSRLTNGVIFVGISNPAPFVICCTVYSVYGMWNLRRRGPEDDFGEVMMFNVAVAAMGKFSEYFV